MKQNNMFAHNTAMVLSDKSLLMIIRYLKLDIYLMGTLMDCLKNEKKNE